MRCAPRASNGPNHLGLCALQVGFPQRLHHRGLQLHHGDRPPPPPSSRSPARPPHPLSRPRYMHEQLDCSRHSSLVSGHSPLLVLLGAWPSSTQFEAMDTTTQLLKDDCRMISCSCLPPTADCPPNVTELDNHVVATCLRLATVVRWLTPWPCFAGQLEVRLGPVRHQDAAGNECFGSTFRPKPGWLECL